MLKQEVKDHLVDLILFDQAKASRIEIDWQLGKSWQIEPSPRAVHHVVQQYLETSKASAWLFWDSALGRPDEKCVLRALSSTGDLWHGGLKLGMGRLPGLIDFINPTWMLNRDPDKEIEATSWRLSLRACLVRTKVLREMGDVQCNFHTLEGAALEMGHRYVMGGVLTRHIPWIIPTGVPAQTVCLPFEDELRFLYYRFGRFWCLWAFVRALLTRYISLRKAACIWWVIYRWQQPQEPKPFNHGIGSPRIKIREARVSVLIPTLDRYSYLRQLLRQMRCQTLMPIEIIIVDQTPIARRDFSLAEEFKDLPLKLIYLDQAGQCSSRNTGLQIAKGEYIFFADDDEEVSETLIESHLKNLLQFRAEVSSGVAHECGNGPLPKHFTYLRASDVFPMGNSLIQRTVLYQSGLLDLAYEHGQRADGDLGIRLYLSGALMILNPEISIFHHHAPCGGLRTHKARVITYASSRSKILHRHLPSTSEIYLAMRYYTPRQVKEMLWLRVFGTFSVRGRYGKKIIKGIIGLVYLPCSIWYVRKKYLEAKGMLRYFPQIAKVADLKTSELKV